MRDFARLRRIAIWVGAVALPLTLLWSIVGAGLYGSPLGEVTPEGAPIVVAYFVLAGPLGLLPLAILGGWWPRLASTLVCAGAAAAFILAQHPWGLQYAAPHLYVDLGPAFAPLAFLTLLLGAAMMAASCGRRWLLQAGVAGGLAVTAALSAVSGIREREDFAPFRTHHPISFLAFAPDGRVLLAAGRSTGVSAPAASLSGIDVASGRVTLLGEGTSRHALSPDGRTLVTVSERGTQFWDVPALKVRARWDRAAAVALANDRAALAVRGGVRLVNLRRGGNHPVVALEVPTSWLAWSPGADLLAIGRYRQDVALLRTAARGSAPEPLPVMEAEAILDGRFSPDGRLLALYRPEPSPRIRLWDVAGQRELEPIDELPPWNTDWFSPDGRTLQTLRTEPAEIGSRLVLTLWDTVGWTRRVSVAVGSLLAWSADGKRFATLDASATPFRVVLRSGEDGSAIETLGSVDLPPACAAFSPDGSLLAVGGDGPILQGYTRGQVVVLPVAAPRR